MNKTCVIMQMNLERERSENMSNIKYANSNEKLFRLNVFVQVTGGKFSLRFNF